MKNRLYIMLLSVALMMFLAGGFAIAQEDEFGDFEEEKGKSGLLTGIEFSGFAEFEQGLNITGEGPHRVGVDGEKLNWMTAYRRFRLQTSKTSDRGGVYAKLDFIRDEVTNRTFIDIREMRIQYRLLKWMDLSVGRQVSTWGVGDMLFINDLFPKNWISMFQGRDMELMKDTSTSIRVTSYIKKFTLDVVYHPKFSPDTTPTGTYFSVFDPNSGQLIANPGARGEMPENEKVSNSLKHGELAVSLKTRIGSQEVALYGYSGFYKNPKGVAYDMNLGYLVPYYPDLTVFGASTEGQVGPGIFTAEVGYYHSREDKKGDNPMIENSMFKWLVGYRMDFSAHLSAGVQWYREQMMDYDAYSASVMMNPYRKKEGQNTFTLRLTYKAQRETLWVNVFSYVRPEDKDHFTHIDISKKLDDNFSITLGANIFTGKDHYEDREFGMLRHDDNVYVRFKYNF